MTKSNIESVAAETGLSVEYVTDVLSLRATQPYPQSLISALEARGLRRFGSGVQYSKSLSYGGAK
jgi:hypothetical protein